MLVQWAVPLLLYCYCVSWHLAFHTHAIIQHSVLFKQLQFYLLMLCAIFLRVVTAPSAFKEANKITTVSYEYTKNLNRINSALHSTEQCQQFITTL